MIRILDKWIEVIDQMKLYPLAMMREEKDSGAAAFRSILRSAHLDLDSRYLQFVFQCREHATTLLDFLTALSFFEVVYELVEREKIFQRYSGHMIFKQHHEYSLFCGQAGSYLLFLSNHRGYFWLHKSIFLDSPIEACVHIRFLGHFPYRKSFVQPFLDRKIVLLTIIWSLGCASIWPLANLFRPLCTLLGLLGIYLISYFFSRKRFTALLSLHELPPSIYQKAQIWYHTWQKAYQLQLLLLGGHVYVVAAYPLTIPLYPVLLGLIYLAHNRSYFAYVMSFYLIILSLLSGIAVLFQPFPLSVLFFAFFLFIWPLFFWLLDLFDQLDKEDFTLLEEWYAMTAVGSATFLFQPIASLEVAGYYFENSTLIWGETLKLHRFYQRFGGPMLKINGEKVTFQIENSMIALYGFYPNFMILPLEETGLAFFNDILDQMLIFLDTLDVFEWVLFLKHPIKEIPLVVREIFGFIYLLSHSNGFYVIESAFLYQDEEMVQRCLRCLVNGEHGCRMILSLPTIKLMNQKNICDIIGNEKVR